MSGEPGSLVGTTSESSPGDIVTTQSAGIAAQPATTIAAKPPRSVTQRWLLAAFLLAGAAQLITISALLSADPLGTSWSALLLAIAPVLLAAIAAFALVAMARPAVVAAVAAVIVGIIGSLASWQSWTSHTGVLFIPALVALVVGGLRLWQIGPR
jgi:hypothetical protein